MYITSLLKQARGNIKGRKGTILALHSYKIYCLLIPKVACSTLRAICAELLDFKLPKGSWLPNVFLNNEFDRFIDVKKRDAVKLNFSDIKKLNNFWGFALVRNPYDRLVSCYSEKIRDDGPEGLFVNGVSTALSKYNVFRRGMSFEEFANEIARINDLWADPHFRSQSSFIFDLKGKIRVSYIGRFETIDKELQILAEHTGKKFSIPHLLKSERKEWESYYTQPLREVVYQRYKRDFHLFGYKK